MALRAVGRTDEAVSHGEAMLRLNPNDNQGVRYLLLNWLLRLGRDDDADRLQRRYKNDRGVDWLWSGALAAFRKQGDSAASRRALARARVEYPHVEAYLLGRGKLPRHLSESVAVGGKEEAAAYVAEAADTWAATPGALEWAAISSTLPTAGARRRGVRKGP
jgi:hypothetical protein